MVWFRIILGRIIIIILYILLLLRSIRVMKEIALK